MAKNLRNQIANLLTENGSLATENSDLKGRIETQRLLLEEKNTQIKDLRALMNHAQDVAANYYRELGVQAQKFNKEIARVKLAAAEQTLAFVQAADKALDHVEASGKLDVERARTETLQECFGHVAELLADRGPRPTEH